MADAVLEVFRGNQEAGAAKQYSVPIAPGMVVLDALHYIQGIWNLIWRYAGIAKPGSAALVRRRSMASRASLARLVWTPCQRTNPSPSIP